MCKALKKWRCSCIIVTNERLILNFLNIVEKFGRSCFQKYTGRSVFFRNKSAICVHICVQMKIEKIYHLSTGWQNKMNLKVNPLYNPNKEKNSRESVRDHLYGFVGLLGLFGTLGFNGILGSLGILGLG